MPDNASRKYQKRLEEAPLLAQLRALLQAKITLIWPDHFADLAPSYQALKSHNMFYIRLCAIINAETAARLGDRTVPVGTTDGLENLRQAPLLAELLTISKDTLRRLLSMEEATRPRSFYQPTKDALAYYLGFEGWGDFCAQQGAPQQDCY